MSAQPTPATEVRLERGTVLHLDTVMAVEQRAYAHPWTRGNFQDALAHGYQVQLLLGGDQLLGYFVAMPGVDEVHLLNLTVAPEFQRQGWAQVLLDALQLWARSRNAQWLWLEVRKSNLRAQSGLALQQNDQYDTLRVRDVIREHLLIHAAIVAQDLEAAQRHT